MSEYSRRWYRKNRKRVVAQRKAYRLAHPDRVLANQLRCQKLYGLRYRRTKLAKLYHTSVEHIDRLLKIKRCGICGSRKQLGIDHNHKTKKVRGRLCSNCNQGIGRFRDNPILLSRAAEYLLCKV
jgi:hypothetical protein